MFVMLLAPSVAMAQRSADLQRGATVRITNRQGQKMVGRFQGSQSDTLAITLGQTSVVMATPISDVARFEVSKGRAHGRGALMGAAIGVVSGMVAGGLFGAATFEKPANCLFVCSRGGAAALGVALIGSGGLVVGTITGAITGTEVWAPVDKTER